MRKITPRNKAIKAIDIITAQPQPRCEIIDNLASAMKYYLPLYQKSPRYTDIWAYNGQILNYIYTAIMQVGGARILQQFPLFNAFSQLETVEQIEEFAKDWKLA